MSNQKKIYVMVGRAWHLAETGHSLAATGRPALRIACTGALVARGHSPERASKQRGACCTRCASPPAPELLIMARRRGAVVAATLRRTAARRSA